jgi:hypothetical protein
MGFYYAHTQPGTIPKQYRSAVTDPPAKPPSYYFVQEQPYVLGGSNRNTEARADYWDPLMAVQRASEAASEVACLHKIHI